MLNKLLSSNSIFYPAFTFVIVIAALIIVPKHLYKKFFLYGLLFGGLADIVIANFATLTGLHQYKGFEPFGIFGIYSFWTPLTWTFAFMLFFYFLPVRISFLVPYILAWSALNFGVGLVMQNLNLFYYSNPDYYLAPIIFILWYSISAYIFRKNEQRTPLRLRE